ncbi:phosphoinositide-3-kinase interacting protein 1 L homeolog [Xenopus laevis]|nr:phosphoinositide-3-kinase interacting protein 1 L homeolog [Xenopus laevis]AAH85210.1 LOC495511 protein [Xenopus laevis]
MLTGTPAPAVTELPQNQIELTESAPLHKEPEQTLQTQEQPVVAQPVISISERVQVNRKEKKDLGTLGYVLGILMVVIIIAIGSGIIVGYIYKRGRDLKQQHNQQVEERRLQLMNLPLSAFLNPTCDIVDENNIEVLSNHTPNTTQDGVAPLMGRAGTPGA